MPDRRSCGTPSSSSPPSAAGSFGTTTTTTTSASLLLAALRARETGGNNAFVCVSYYDDDDDDDEKKSNDEENRGRRRAKGKKNAGKKKKNLENEMRVDDDDDDDNDELLGDKTEETEGEDDEENDRKREDAKCCYAPPLSPTTTLHNYVEQDSLKRFTASYCPLVPNPRSTIANAYSSDGKRVASTHGDHTVKIIDVATGLCVKVLAGHRRTPWVVRFHPSDPNILASGSLDNTVRVWDISEDKDGVQSEGGKCIAVRDFNKPIASIAFSLDGGCVLVASGHRLTYWRYPDYQSQLQQQQQQQQQQMMIDEVNNQSGTTIESTQQQPMEESKETVNILLKTKRSLRCALFRPRGLPLILTAEVNDIGLEHTPGSSMGAANLAVTGLSYTGPSPFVAVQMPRDLQSGVYVARGFRGNFNSVHNQQQQRNAAEQAATKKKKQQEEANNRNKSEENKSENQLLDNIDNEDGTQNMVSSAPTTRTSRTMTDFDRAASRRRASIDLERTTGIAPRGRLVAPMDVDTTAEVAAAVGGYIRRTQRINQRQNVGNMDGREGPAPSPADVDINDGDIEIVEDPHDGYDATASEQRLAAIRNTIGGLRVVDIHGRDAAYDAGASRFAQQVAEETSSRPGQEQPCAVQIKLWRYNPANVNVALENACLTLRRAVLCSEMGAHFSPCGNFLAACVICQHHAVGEHLYELRVYSLQKRNFGEVLSARRIRAAHCLTSVQFSPTSEHVLVAYGRKHSSLILLVADGGNYQPVHTILEVYRVADMGLVRVIPSAEDEVNAATFHPHPGGGLVYGTKEGRLRLLRFEGGRDKRHRKNKNRNGRPNSPRSMPSLEDELMVRRRSANEEINSDDDEDYDVIDDDVIDDDAVDAENP